MLDRLSPECKAALTWARDEAAARGVREITPEHIYLGLVSQSPGALGLAMHHLGLELDDLTRHVEASLPRNRRPTRAQNVVLSELARSVLVNTEVEADALHHRLVRPEHVLLGLARVPNTVVARLLAQRHVDLPALRSIASEMGAGVDSNDNTPLTRSERAARDYDVRIVWDPSVVDPADYAKLVKLLGDVARGSGGLGIERSGTVGVGVTVNVGVGG